MIDGLSPQEFEALPERARQMILAQQARIVEQDEAQAALSDRHAELAALNARLEHLIEEFKQALHGKRSEKLDPNQLELLAEDIETAIYATEAEARAKGLGRRRRGEPSKRNIGRLPQELTRLECIVEPASRLCPCGCGEMVKVGEDRSERLDILPAQFQVIATIRPKYACRTCQAMSQAPAPAHLIESGLPTEGLLAHVLVAKYADHQPLYRQAQICARQGINLDRSTLCRWVGEAGFALAPVVERLAWRLKQSTKLFMDETRAPVLDPGRGATKTGYLWALVRDDRSWGGSDPPGVVYFYADGRAGAHAEGFLQGFSGILQVDAYAGYNRLKRADRDGGPIKLALCWAHARRKLTEIHQKDASPIAAEGLRRIAELYAIEKEIRGLVPAERLAARQERSAPKVEAFGIWLKEKRARISAKSRLGEKLSYIHNQWDGLQVFLEDGRIEIDSNPCENRIRPLALGRKNHLFAGHDEGARAWANIASLVETCKANAVDPFAYLKSTLEAIVGGHPQSRIDALLPGPFACAG